MKTSLLLFFILVFTPFYLRAQTAPDLTKYKTIGEKINGWHAYCNELMATQDDKQYRLLANEAKKGIQLSPPDSLRAKAMFSLFAGVAHENMKEYDIAETYFNTVLEIASKLNKINYLVLAITRLDNIYSFTNNTIKRKETIARLIAMGDTTSNETIKSELYNVLSGYYRDINNYDSSIAYRLKNIKLHKELLAKKVLADTINLAYALTNLGNMFNETGQYNKALEYLYEGGSIIGDRALTGNEETLYLYFIDAYSGLKMEDSLLKYYHLINTKMSGRDTLFNVLTTANQLIGEFYKNKNDPEKALRFATKAYSYGKQSANPDGRIQANTLYASLLYDKKYYREALAVLNNTRGENFEFDKQLLADIHKTTAGCYAGLQQWDSAYLYYKKYSEANEAILQATANQNIADAEAKFQNKEKQQQIENKNIQIAAAKKERLWLIGGLSLLALSAVLLYTIYRNKKKTADLFDKKNKTLAKLNNELEEANKTKAKLFSIIGHDLRSPISRVYQFLKLQQLNPKALNEMQKNELSNKIQTATGSLLETMEDLLLWSKTQMSEFKVNLQEISITDTVVACQNLLQLNSDAKNIQYEIDIQESHFVKADKYYLQTIIRNLLQNAIKASGTGSTINIDTKQKNQTIILSIENTGNPFTQLQYEDLLKNEETDKMLTGLGLKLTQELCDKMGAYLHFSSTTTQTTLTQLTLSAI